MSALAMAGGYAADVALGDPQRGHPVAGFGQSAAALEGAIYAPSRVRGAVYTAALVGAAAAAGQALSRLIGRGPALAVVLWASLGGRSLTRVATRLGAQVQAGDIEGARATLPSLCGRDPRALDATGLSRAAVESVAENTGDAVMGPLLWGLVAGPAGVAAYRAANTLDAMVGHHNDRYEQFGWAAARLDDAMSWPAARLGAGLAVLCAPLVGGSPARALAVLRRDGAAHPSPNAGRIEAAYAGALDVRLGGPLTYGERVELRPRLGDGTQPVAADIARAARLSAATGAIAAAGCALLAHRRWSR